MRCYTLFSNHDRHWKRRCWIFQYSVTWRSVIGRALTRLDSVTSPLMRSVISDYECQNWDCNPGPQGRSVKHCIKLSDSSTQWNKNGANTVSFTFWRCMHRASYCNVYISRPTRCTNSYNVSLFIIKCSTCFGPFSPSSGATFWSCTSQLVQAGTVLRLEPQDRAVRHFCMICTELQIE